MNPKSGGQGGGAGGQGTAGMPVSSGSHGTAGTGATAGVSATQGQSPAGANLTAVSVADEKTSIAPAAKPAVVPDNSAELAARRRETATAIARQRLLSAYRHTAVQNLAEADAKAQAELDARQSGSAANQSAISTASAPAVAQSSAQNSSPSPAPIQNSTASTSPQNPRQPAGRPSVSSQNPQLPTHAHTETPRAVAATAFTPLGNGNSAPRPEDQAADASPLSGLARRDARVDAETWRRYHAAWQGYYQKYYGEYYANAARTYVAKEKLRSFRAQEDEKKLLAESGLEAAVNAPEPEIGTITGLHLREKLRRKIRGSAIEQAKDNKRRRRLLWPILAGVAVVLVFLFLQYNRLIFAPLIAYISPGNADSSISTVDPTVATAVNAEDTLIIPKINVDVPVHFGISNDTETVMAAMSAGVAHWMIPGASAFPGQIGNVVITGHSAGDVYSSYEYKFIFSGLERLEAGDTIYIDYEGARYTYTVYDKQVVSPSDVSSLQYSGDEAILTLVTCTPLGTSTNRLLVFARQINPSIGDDTATQTETADAAGAIEMPANEPTFFESIWNFLTGQ